MKRIHFFILTLIFACKGLQAQERVTDIDTTNTTSRITGGFGINIEDAPWQALLVVNDRLDYPCGGSIIKKRT